MAAKRLYRSATNKVIGGVCGGLGNYFNIDPVLFRVIFLVLFVGACSGLLLYIIMWIVIPMEPFFPMDNNSGYNNEGQNNTY